MEKGIARMAATLSVPFWLGIEDGYLVSDQTAPTHAIPKPTMLEDFLMIKTDQEILKFARKWGTLGICKLHGNPGCGKRLLDGQVCGPEQVGLVGKGLVWREPLWDWHIAIARANALRRIGESIQSGGAGSKSDWESLIIPVDHSAERVNRELARILAERGADHLGQPWKSARSAKRKFSWIMQGWLDLGNVRPSFIWDRDRWAIKSSIPMRVWPLFGHLALYLAVAIAGGTQAVNCSFCGREYFPRRRPTPGQRNCCGDKPCKQDYWREHKRGRAVRAERQKSGVKGMRSR